MATGRLRPEAKIDERAAHALAEMVGARIHVPVTIPRTSVKGQMRLVDRDEGIEITTETMRLFRERGLIDEHGRVFHVAIDDWNAEFAVRHLAIAVRDPIDASKPLDSLDEWRECDDDQIESLWSDYKDHRQRIDPLGNGAAPLSDAEMSLIEDAVKKKELAVLMSFGSLKLASYLTTSAERPAS